MVQGVPAGKALSTKPEHIRKRIRNRTTPLARDVDMLANAVKPVEEWDMEELARGRPRDVDGAFRGRPPKWITPAIRSEAARRLKVEAHVLLSGHISDAIKVIADLMLNAEDDRIRFQAATFIVEHVVGKARQSVDLELGEGARGFLAKAVATRSKATGELVDAHPVIDLGSDEWTDGDDA